jgi:hypothetical protein
MWLFWQPEAFSDVHDYDTWSPELEDDPDIARHIELGDCVPINIGQDMAAAFIVRVPEAGGIAELTEREATYLVVSSQPYLFVSHGSALLTGIEGVMGGLPQADVNLTAGRWAVTVHLIAWDDEPGAKAGDDPGPDALPDFILLVNRADDVQPFRGEVSTFPNA